jgi:hypothetical protein
MNRALRIVMVVMLAVQAIVLVMAAAVFSRMLTDQRMSMNGMDPRRGSAGLWVFALVYLVLAALLILVLLPERPRHLVLRRLRTPALVVGIVVHFPIVLLSLTLAGWPVFGWTMVLLTLLTAALLGNGDGAVPAVRPASHRPRPSTGQ